MKLKQPLDYALCEAHINSVLTAQGTGTAETA